jgi:hypothetical protein
MAKGRRDRPEFLALVEEQRREGVAEVMEADVPDACPRDSDLER